jgi:hypothetical protein
MIRHASLFSQLVVLFNSTQFHNLVFRHKAERYCKGFDTWDHFLAMLFCQLAQAKSLREICGGLSYCLEKLRHLGVKRAPSKSTLSYANALRPWQMYQELFYQTLDVCKLAGTGKHGIFHVALHAGAWIETSNCDTSGELSQVAFHAGAWIETFGLNGHIAL